MVRTGSGVLLALLCAVSLLAAARPNVVIIMADDLGYSDLGCYGGEIRTPNIDGLAADGVRFTGFKNTCRCAPSRASLLTGRYQHAVGVGAMTQADRGPAYRGQLSKTAPTLAEILSAHNYATGMVGKWHLSLVTDEEKRKGSFPCDRGFDFFHGTWWGAKSFFSPEYMMKNHQHLENGNYPADYYLTTDLSKSAIDFVKSQKVDQPFFLYLAHYAPHKPIQAPQARVDQCLERYRVGFETLQKERFARQQELGVLPEHCELAAGMPAWDTLSKAKKEKWTHTMATYAAMIEIMDDGIGQLIDLLKKRGQYENTLFLVLSDNGSTSEGKGDDSYSRLSNTPFRGMKAQPLEGGIASPLIVSWPAKLSEHAGHVRHGPCHIIDLLPTCLEATALPFPATFRGGRPAAPHGESLLDMAAGSPHTQRALFWEHFGRRAVYQDGWKLVKTNKSWELHHLAVDPSEQHNLAKQFPERAEKLRQAWMTWARTYRVLLNE
jgi:arylsulfatase A-like enzyme